MASEYQIDFTDKNINRSFKLSQYTTNGPQDPTSSALDSSAVNAATSLLLYGKGSPNYGERILENMVHMLEHFSGEDEPVSPITGQLWFDRSISPNQLKVFDNTKHEITGVVVGTSTVTIEGDHVARFTALKDRGIRLRIVITDPVVIDDDFLTVIITSVALSGLDTELVVAPGITAPSSGQIWFVGGWESIRQDNAPIHGDIDLQDANYIINPADPTDGTHVGDRAYNDGRYVEITGDTMTGTLSIPLVPTLDPHAASKKYVDDEIVSSLAGSGFVEKSGDIMSGFLTLHSNPSDDYHAATKLYVDLEVASVVAGTAVNIEDLNNVTITSPLTGDILAYNFTTSTWENQNLASSGFLPTSGGTMTGFITLHADPSADEHAANKNYVDDQLYSITGGTLGVIVSGSFDSGTGTLTLYRSTGALIDITGFGSGGGGGETISVAHLNNPNYQESISGDFIETQFNDQPGFPSLKVSDIIQRFSEIAESSRSANSRVILTTGGGATEVLTTYDGSMSYLPGYNHLFLYVTGVKYIASTRGFQEIEHDDGHVSANQGEGFFPALYTGFANNATIYSMNVSIDGGGAIPINVTGSDAQTFITLVDQINIDLTTSAKAVIEDGRIIIYSSTNGSSSTVSITDTNLISNLTGEDSSGATVWSAATTYAPGNIVSYDDGGGDDYFIALRSNLNSQPDWSRDNWRIVMEFIPSLAGAQPGVTYGYSEDGQYGEYSDQITFEAGSIPTAGSILEATTIQPQLQYQ